MRSSNHLIRAIPALIFLSLVACSTAPTLTGSWHDESFTGKFHNVLVVGISAKQTPRRLYEDTLVNSLHAKGIEATALYKIRTGDDVPDKAMIEAVLKEQSFDAVITTRVIGRDKETQYVPGTVQPPPYYRGMYSYVDTVYPAVYTPGYLVNDTIISLESNGYDASSAKLVWSITTEHFNPSDLDKEVNDLATLIINQLEKSGLI